MARLVIGTSKAKTVPAVVKEVQLVEPYALLSRVKDDGNNDIGCVVGYRFDSNNQKYAVICLNKQYRKQTFFNWTSDFVNVSGIPLYNNVDVYSSTETATFNCDKIMDWVNGSSGRSSGAVSECRSYSFVIGGVTYYGQLPTLSELLLILMNKTYINSNDPSGSGVEIQNYSYWSSNQEETNFAWYTMDVGYVNTFAKNNSGRCRVVPILEIPIQ